MKIESEINTILQAFIEISFDIMIITYIKNVFDSVKEQALKRLSFIDNL
jgi:hypothetical protein